MSSVLYRVEARVARITLNEPDKRNPLNQTLVGELIAALERAQEAADVSVVLLAAAGDSFCAGGDLREFQNFRNLPTTEIYDQGQGTAGLFKLLGIYRKPIVAAVNGPAFGGGCGLACASSIVIASERARFGTTELRLGLFPLVILPSIRSAVGDRKAMEMALTGEIFDAAAAQSLGIVSRVVAHEQLAAEAWATAARIASFSPIALQLGVEAFRTSTGMDVVKAIDYLNALRVVVYHTEDLREGATAFLEKRPPAWVGR